MIYDKIEFADLYHFSPAVIKALDFLKTITPATPFGIYEIQGKDIYANVQSYITSELAPDLLEGHQEYVDIQAVITGEEYIVVSQLEGLQLGVDYASEIDMAFYKSPANPAKMHMTPGTFLLLFPQDAHMGKVTVTNNQTIKKVVLKIKRNLV